MMHLQALALCGTQMTEAIKLWDQWLSMAIKMLGNTSHHERINFQVLSHFYRYAVCDPSEAGAIKIFSCQLETCAGTSKKLIRILGVTWSYQAGAHSR